MKKFLLITMSIILSGLVYSQNLDYYKTILPKNNFEVKDILNDEYGYTYVLTEFKGAHNVPGLNTPLESPNGKQAFAVLAYSENSVKVVTKSSSSSTTGAGVYGFKMSKQSHSLIIMGDKGSGNLEIDGSTDGLTNAQAFFLEYLRLGTQANVNHKVVKSFEFEASGSTGPPFNQVIPGKCSFGGFDSYPYNTSTTNDYIVFAVTTGGEGYITVDGTTYNKDSEYGNAFVIEINIWGSSAQSYAVNWVKQLDIPAPVTTGPLGTPSISSNAISDLAINNNSIVLIGSSDGTIDLGPNNDTQDLDLGSNKKVFVARYTKTLTYQDKYALSEDADVSIIADKTNHFYITYQEANYGMFSSNPELSDVDVNFKSTNTQHISGDFCVARYDEDLDFEWKVDDIGVSKIGINEDNELCILSSFEGTKDFNPNGATAYYTADYWSTTDPKGLFLGRYEASNGTLVNGNTMKIDGGSNFLLGTGKENTQIAIVSQATKVGFDLGIAEDTLFYNDTTYFISTYSPCSKSTFSGQLSYQTVCNNATLNAEISGIDFTTEANNLHYYWFKDNQLLSNGSSDNGLISNATTGTLNIGDITPEATGNYKLKIKSSCDVLTETDDIDINVLARTNITQQPTSKNVCENSTTSFSLQADHTSAYQWQVDNLNGGFNDISGETSETLNLNSLSPDMNGYGYRCKITAQDNCNESYTSTAQLSIKIVPQVLAQPQANTETCEGSNTSISITAQGTNISYQWQVSDDGNTFTNISSSNTDYYGTQTPTLGFNNPVLEDNTRFYRCFVSNECDNTSSNAVHLLVREVAQLNTHPESQNICESEDVSFNITADGDGLMYTWQVNAGGGWIDLDNDNHYNGVHSPSLTIHSVGMYMNNYEYRCEISSPCHDDIYSNPATLNILPKPNNVSISSSMGLDICEGNSTQLSVSGANSSYTYQWKLNSSNISGETNSTLTVSEPGAYSVYVVNSSGCSYETSNLIINVHELPNNTSTLTGSEQLCEGESCQIVVPTGNGYSYQWYQNNMLISGETSNSITVTQTGTYYAQISNNHGCTNNSEEENITVTPLPERTLSISESDICEGESTTISIENAESGDSYQWLRNGTILDDETSNNLSVNQTGVYSLITTNNNCSATSNGVNLDVHALPTSEISIVGDSIVCEGEIIELLASAGSDTYQWFKDNEIIDGATENSYSATENGTYQVKVINSYNCEQISEGKVLDFNPLPNVELNNMNPEICQGEFFEFSVSEQENHSYQWFLNNSEIPEGNSYNIEVNEAGLYKVSVTNLETSCSSISEYATLSVHALPTPSISASGELVTCVDDTITLNLNDTYSAYLWNDNSTSESLQVTSEGTYSVTVTDENNCQNNAEIEVNEILVSTPDICMVTVDTTINKNLIVWEKESGVSGIASYNIYKLVSNSYELIGNVLYNDTTEFIDMGSEPDVHADKYVIASVDSCDNIGAYSPYHQTMNLSITNSGENGVALIWTKYIDESGVNNPTEYQIYRGVNELNYHASVTGGLSDYSYNIPNILENERFIIVVQMPEACAPLNNTKANGGPYYNSVSNIEDEGLMPDNITTITPNSFSIYPNPTKDKINIQSDEPIERVRVLDISGKLILDQKANTEREYSLNLDNFSKGLYFIEVNGHKEKLVIK